MNKVAAIQMTSTTNVEENLKTVEHLFNKLVDEGAELVVLPEMFPIQGKTPFDKINIAEALGDGRIQNFLSEQAKRKNIWIVGGTIPIKSKNPLKIKASCLVFNSQGQRVACYNKIHLFDVKLSETESYFESETTEPGNSLAIVNTPFGKLGLAVCYDVRFPEMFRCLFNQGAEIFALPCAFSVKTGHAHYEVLVRARAIENFSYFITACQSGRHENKRETYGHSLIVSPWGEVVNSIASGQGFILADIDLKYLRKIRQDIPILNHQKIVLKEFALSTTKCKTEISC